MSCHVMQCEDMTYLVMFFAILCCDVLSLSPPLSSHAHRGSTGSLIAALSIPEPLPHLSATLPTH
eukprot:754660-Hanusia_phi.AAC.5